MPRLFMLLVLPHVISGAAVVPSTKAIGSVRAIVHQLTVSPPHQASGAGRVRQPLFVAYGLHTRAADRAAVGFTDLSTLRINQNTDLTLRSANMTLLSKGEVAVTDSAGSHHTVQSATALVSAIGTLYDVRIERAPGNGYATPTRLTFPPGTTTVSVVSGLVRVRNQFGGVTVRAGRWTHVPPGRPPTRPTRHNARHDVSWTAGL